MENDKQLKAFESSIRSAVLEKKHEIESQMKEYKKEELEDFENKLLEEAFIKMQEKVSALNSETRLELKEISNKYKSELSSLANTYYDKIFLEVMERLTLYTETTDYKSSLCEKIFSLEKLMSVILSSRDMDIAPRLKERGISCSSNDEEVLIGGFVAVFNDGSKKDFSFFEALAREKESFLKESPLLK